MKKNYHKVFFVLLVQLLLLQATRAQNMQFTYDANGNLTIKKINSIMPEKPSISQNDQQLISTANSGNQWFLGEDSIPGAVNQIYQPTVSGFYKVRVRNNLGCASLFSDPFQFVLTSIVNLPSDQFIKIGPNPTVNNTYLYFYLLNIFQVDILMFDVNGRIVFTQNAVRSGQALVLSHLSAGMYLIKVQSKDKKIDITMAIIKN